MMRTILAIIFLALWPPENAQPLESLKAQCASRLKNFVVRMDELLSENPKTTPPLFALLKEHFPIKGCDIEEAIAISRQSRYFASVEDNASMFAIWFGTAKLFPDQIFAVTFAIEKKSGDTRFPSFKPNKWLVP
jgi:hypothetical protein